MRRGRSQVHRPETPLLAPQHVEAHVGGDPVQPGAYRGSALEAVVRPPGLEERRLHGVLGLERRTQHAIAVPGELASVLLQPLLHRERSGGARALGGGHCGHLPRDGGDPMLPRRPWPARRLQGMRFERRPPRVGAPIVEPDATGERLPHDPDIAAPHQGDSRPTRRSSPTTDRRPVRAWLAVIAMLAAAAAVVVLGWLLVVDEDAETGDVTGAASVVEVSPRSSAERCRRGRLTGAGHVALRAPLPAPSAWQGVVGVAFGGVDDPGGPSTPPVTAPQRVPRFSEPSPRVSRSPGCPMRGQRENSEHPGPPALSTTAARVR